MTASELTVKVNNDSADTVDIFLGDHKVGSTIFTSEGTFQIPLVMLSTSDPLRNALRAANNRVDKSNALEGAWAWLAENAPTSKGFNVEWTSEYDDEGGYFWSASFLIDWGNVDEPDDADDLMYEFSDFMYSIYVDRSFLDDGNYERP